MGLQWEERKPAKGEARKCRARLPENAGWLNLTEYDGSGFRHGQSFALHYMANNVPDGLPKFSGMLLLENWQGGMDALKSAALGLATEDMAGKAAACGAKIKAVNRVLDSCRGAKEVP